MFINDKQVFSLFEVARSIQKTLSERYSNVYWVKAEISKLNYYNHSGHCYPDLVEKRDGKVICQLRSVLWRDDFIEINDKFVRTLNEPLRDGIKILALLRIGFDPVHGLALNIIDIDPGYTLGDLEREKQETMKKLQDEGVYGMNKALKFPFLPQRIALISVETSKGYADFLKVIDQNEWQYKFFRHLFPAVLQGERAVEAIIQQLNRIKKVITHFDVVAIVRGGGGDIGLSCYNNYKLARAVATFPIPVITGIGHATNETVVEMVAHYNAITPTKLADYLTQKFHNFSVPVQKAEEKIIDRSQRLLLEERNRFHAEVKLFRSTTKKHITGNKHEINLLSRTLSQHSRFVIKNHKEFLRMALEGMTKNVFLFGTRTKLQLKDLTMVVKKDSLRFLKVRDAELVSVQKNIENMSPENVLRRGYSITLLNGKSVTSVRQVLPGNTISTKVLDGIIDSTVESVNNSE
jgi:exodeoxyribonuclease VII large subunit